MIGDAMTLEPEHARLLIVDDEPAVMDALCETLRLRGYDVTGFSDTDVALEAIGPGRFDVLLVDLTMPQMTGVELLREAQRRDPDLVGVIMTGASPAATAAAAAEAGADFVLKPLSLKDLLPVLSRAVARRRGRITLKP